jgi:hypothetical protein
VDPEELERLTSTRDVGVLLENWGQSTRSQEAGG